MKKHKDWFIIQCKKASNWFRKTVFNAEAWLQVRYKRFKRWQNNRPVVQLAIDIVTKARGPEDTSTGGEENGPSDETGEKPSQKKGHFNLVVAAVTTTVLTLIFIAVINTLAQHPGLSPGPDTANGSTVASISASKAETLAKADKFMKDCGWEDGWYVLDKVDKSKDKSTSGQNYFSGKPVQSAAEMVAFLRTNSDEAKTLMNNIINVTGVTKEDVLNDFNWVAVQSLIPFQYPVNTVYKDGVTEVVGSKDGDIGDIFMLFISPKPPVSTTDTDNGSGAIAVRGACANPQGRIPIPRIQGLTPKSSNINDYQRPGTDNTRDSGDGNKPPATVTTPAESSPPAVNTTPTPITSPGATPVETPRTPPPPEQGVNPPGGTNTTAPGNPFK